MKRYVLISGIFGLAVSLSAQTIEWNGAGDGMSLFQEANWVITAGTIGAAGVGDAPPAGTVDGNVAVAANVMIPSGTPGGAAGAAPNFDIGSGKNLSMSSGVLRMNAVGVRGESGGGNRPMIMTGDSHAIVQYLVRMAPTLDDTSSILLNGGGNPLNPAPTTMLSTGARLQFNAETPTQFVTEHLGKVNVNGIAGTVGTDPLVFEPGDNLVVSAFNGALGSEVAPVRNTLVWAGGGADATDFFGDDNWTGTASGGALSNVSLPDHYSITDSAAAITDTQALKFNNGTFAMTAGSLTLTGGTAGLGVLSDAVVDTLGQVALDGTAEVKAQFIAEVSLSLGGSASLELNGGGTPVNQSTIDFTSLSAGLFFNAETPDAFIVEHIGSIMLFGAAPVWGSDPKVIESGDTMVVQAYNGAAGSQVIALAIPEPATLVVFLGGLLLVARRFRRA